MAGEQPKKRFLLSSGRYASFTDAETTVSQLFVKLEELKIITRTANRRIQWQHIRNLLEQHCKYELIK